MEIIQKSFDMQQRSLELCQKGKKIALVPTMGFLHEGHMRLVDIAKEQADIVILTIFVNPTQFGPSEDFDKYPRDLKRDQSLTEARGVDFLFVPSAQEIYPPDDQTFVLVTEVTRGLCGPFRPGHFRGVTTVVAKLFLITQPQLALFGEKDYQQLMAIKRMVFDLHFPIKIVGVPTVREPSGLAMSSRNTYLDPQEKAEALNLYKAIQLAQDMVKKGECRSKVILEAVHFQLASGTKTQIEYSEIVTAELLTSVEKADKTSRLIMSIRVNGKRLIDNGPLVS